MFALAEVSMNLIPCSRAIWDKSMMSFVTQYSSTQQWKPMEFLISCHCIPEKFCETKCVLRIQVDCDVMLWLLGRRFQKFLWNMGTAYSVNALGLLDPCRQRHSIFSKCDEPHTQWHGVIPKETWILGNTATNISYLIKDVLQQNQEIFQLTTHKNETYFVFELTLSFRLLYQEWLNLAFEIPIFDSNSRNTSEKREVFL